MERLLEVLLHDVTGFSTSRYAKGTRESQAWSEGCARLACITGLHHWLAIWHSPKRVLATLTWQECFLVLTASNVTDNHEWDPQHSAGKEKASRSTPSLVSGFVIEQ